MKGASVSALQSAQCPGTGLVPQNSSWGPGVRCLRAHQRTRCASPSAPEGVSASGLLQRAQMGREPPFRGWCSGREAAEGRAGRPRGIQDRGDRGVRGGPRLRAEEPSPDGSFAESDREFPTARSRVQTRTLPARPPARPPARSPTALGDRAPSDQPRTRSGPAGWTRTHRAGVPGRATGASTAQRPAASPAAAPGET